MSAGLLGKETDLFSGKDKGVGSLFSTTHRVFGADPLVSKNARATPRCREYHNPCPFLQLLAGAGMVVGLQKYSGGMARQRASSPKLQVLNTALMSALSGRTLTTARKDLRYWGRVVESAIETHLANTAATGVIELYYWRDRNREVDFVIRQGESVTAIEVKSSCRGESLPGMEAFTATFHPSRTFLVGGDGIAIEDFLSRPVEHWVRH